MTVTDRITGNTGRGFVVHGGYILTAAHCVPWDCQGGMALDKPFSINVITANNITLTGHVVAVEPVSDIAVIGSPDDRFPGIARSFESFTETAEALMLCADEFPLDEEFPVHIFTRLAEWLPGKAAQQKKRSILSVTTAPTVPDGTSGSAIVNDKGEVVGVVSNSSELVSGGSATQEPGDGTCARPCQALPVWLWRAIKVAENEARP
ncbi:MAG: serine protease [Thermoguttaceae bacterium]